jgi:hypothetical protein
VVAAPRLRPSCSRRACGMPRNVGCLGMSTPPDVLAKLRANGVLPTYWRRKRETAKWHRGFRQGPLMVRSQCGKLAAADGGRLLFASIDEPWPEPHCPACERATPGSDAVREAVSGSHPVPKSRRRHL